MSYDRDRGGSNVAGWGFLILLAGVVIGGLMWGMPQYSIYSSRLAGEAELAQAEYSKKVLVQTAQAKKDSAQLEADAEAIHADGVARANKIIADGLGGPEGYLRWKFIQTLKETAEHTGTQIIYVPTEASLPILEATRAQHSK